MGNRPGNRMAFQSDTLPAICALLRMPKEAVNFIMAPSSAVRHCAATSKAFSVKFVQMSGHPDEVTWIQLTDETFRSNLVPSDSMLRQVLS